jgi:hypothetical protein
MVSKPLSIEDYKILEAADVASGFELCGLLNRNGCANWTVCPLCHVDDFTHVETCELCRGQSAPNTGEVDA